MPYKKGKHWMARVQKQGQIRTRQCDSKVEALAVEVAMREEDWSLEPLRTLTVLEWANEYLAYAKERFSDKTYREKERAFADLFRTPGIVLTMPVEDLSPRMALLLANRRANAVSGYAANKDRKNLVAGWVWGVTFFGLPKDNPFQAVPRKAEKRSPRYVPTEVDFWKVYDQANEQDKVMLLTMLHTAGRKEEILSLRWSEIDFAENKIRLWTNKRMGGNRECDLLPLTAELRTALWKHRAGANSVYVFAKENGRRYTHRVHLMVYLCGLAKVKAFGFHAIRHLSASILDRAGLDLATIQAILRHKSATTTAKYLHSLRGTKVALDEAFGGKVVQLKMAPAESTR